MFMNPMEPFVPYGDFYLNQDLYSMPSVKPACPFASIDQLEDLQKLLLSDEWTINKWQSWKGDIQAFIHRHQNNTVELDRFISALLGGMLLKEPQETLKFLAEILDLQTVNALARFKAQSRDFPPFESAVEWAKQRAFLYPQKVEPSLKERFCMEWSRYRPVVLYFIPNLINIFLGAFNFLDSRKKFTTLWEKHLLLEIVYKFFVIPFCLIQILQPIFVVTAKVYVIAACIIVGMGILLACYQRWFKPLPDEIVNCTNQDKQMDLGYIEPKVGQTEGLNRLISALLTGSNVLLIGKSGDGKTALLHHLIQLKKEGKLPKELQELANYEVDCGLLISSLTFGHSELINQIKDQLEGYEKQVLFHMDEIDQLVRNNGAFQTFKKRFLEDQPSPRFIATTTFKEFEKIKELDVDGSFRRRVVTIVIDGEAEEQNRLVLYELINRTASKIPVTEEAIETVLELSKSQDYLPHIGRPAKVIKMMKEAISRCEWVYNQDFVSPQLDQVRYELQQLNAKISRNLKENREDLQAYVNLQARVKVLEGEELEHKQQIQKIKGIIEQELTFKERYFKLTHQVAGTVSNQRTRGDGRRAENPAIPSPATEEEQRLYLLSYFYGVDAFKSIIGAELDKIKDVLKVQVDAALIREVFEEAKNIDRRIGDEIGGPRVQTTQNELPGLEPTEQDDEIEK